MNNDTQSSRRAKAAPRPRNRGNSTLMGSAGWTWGYRVVMHVRR
jgi:hypothetical protein